MALIDDFVADPHFREQHDLVVNASPEATLAAAERYRTETDRFFQQMIGLRELPMRLLLRMSSKDRVATPVFGIDDFTLLARNGEEIVYGLAGRFWRADFGLVQFENGEAFGTLSEPGIAKLALNFAVEPRGRGTALSTETRVLCCDRAARLAFTPYWYAIRPVSGLIRRRILSSIRKDAQRSIPAPPSVVPLD